MENERPTPLIDDLDGTRTKLEGWFEQRMGHPVGISELNIPESTGMSNVTLLFDINWQDGDGSHRQACVGRLQPEIERPVFPGYDLSLQYEVMDSIGRHSDIPVPQLLGLETDKSLLGVQFYIMKHTAGRIPTDIPPYNMDGWMLHETSESQRETMWYAAVDTMARFHRLDFRELGFGRLADPVRSPLQQQLDYWQAYHDWSLEGDTHAVCSTALAWLQANQPGEEHTSLCWGDARLANIIFNESLNGVAAVLDWEMAVLGNPLQDIAWFNYLDATFAQGLGMPRLEGLPSYEDSLARWQQKSDQSVEHYDYYTVFAGLRFGLILSRIMFATGQDQEVQGNFAVQMLQRTLDEKTRG